MQSKILALAASISLAFVSFGAEAMPAGPVAKAPSNIQLAAEGCGPGFARGPYGGCRRIVVERPVVVAPARPVVVVPARPVVRAAPCGVRVGPVGVHTPC